MKQVAVKMLLLFSFSPFLYAMKGVDLPKNQTNKPTSIPRPLRINPLAALLLGKVETKEKPQATIRRSPAINDLAALYRQGQNKEAVK